MQPIRLQKLFTDCGVLSRRAAEEEIRLGNVRVNGHPAHIGDKVHPVNDIVLWKGKRLALAPKEHTYIMLNKPRGYITTAKDEADRKCVIDLIADHKGRVYPIGRLDKVSEGMLLFTDDGELANRMTHPSHTIAKHYRVKVAGKVSDEQLACLTSELVIDGYKIRPVEVHIQSTDDSGTVLKMDLFEGRNRQIRKMCEIANLTVKRLSRVGIGSLKLNNLTMGKWRHLTNEEVAYLKKALDMRK